MFLTFRLRETTTARLLAEEQEKESG